MGLVARERLAFFVLFTTVINVQLDLHREGFEAFLLLHVDLAYLVLVSTTALLYGDLPLYLHDLRLNVLRGAARSYLLGTDLRGFRRRVVNLGLSGRVLGRHLGKFVFEFFHLLLVMFTLLLRSFHLNQSNINVM